MIAGQLDVIDAKLDALLSAKQDDGWGAWEPVPEDEAQIPGSDGDLIADLYADMEAREPEEVQVDEENSEVRIKPVSEEKMEKRRQFEREHLKIAEALGSEADPAVDYTEVYAKAGPLWLFHGNLDLFMTYGYEIRQAMCQDVIEDAPKAGADMSLWALKQDGESGPGSVAMGSEASAIPQGKRFWNGG